VNTDAERHRDIMAAAVANGSGLQQQQQQQQQLLSIQQQDDEVSAAAAAAASTPPPPRTLADALEYDDPIAALRSFASNSRRRADALSDELDAMLRTAASSRRSKLPDLLLAAAATNSSSSSAGAAGSSSSSQARKEAERSLDTALACSDSIYHSLTKIASGGSQASQEIRLLEQEKSDLDRHADDVAEALALRRSAQLAQQGLQAQAWLSTAQSVRPYLDWQEREENKVPPPPSSSSEPGIDSYTRVKEYAGEYAIRQLETTHASLKAQVLDAYRHAVAQSDLQSIGQLTPVLSLIKLEKQAVELYLQFLKASLQSEMRAAVQADNDKQPKQKGQQQQIPFADMARVYNTAVQCLRHHLPLVSHCLYKAQGDAAVVQLVHVTVEQFVLPLLQDYQTAKQFDSVSRNAEQIAAGLEERYGTGRGGGLIDDHSGSADVDADDCGFSSTIGTLQDVDAAMDEAALCLQHSESYIRFLQHTCREVNNARRIRFDNERQALRLEKEREEWASGKRNSRTSSGGKDDDQDEQYEDVQILPNSTPLHQALAELGGQYAGIERCLLLASMQRAFVSSDEDPRYYRPLSLSSAASGMTADSALQTTVVDTCLYAARRSTQRAFATGHTGTASAVTNFCVDALMGVALEVLSHNAEESGVAVLKPGEGLLVGSAGIFNPAFIRQHHHAVAAHAAVLGGGAGTASSAKDELIRKQHISEGVARACAFINDLEVAVHHTTQLEALLTETVAKGYPAGQHDTEQLQMCVKSLRNVADSFHVASNGAVESLESVLRPRIRSIVGEAVGTEGSAAAPGSTAGFMASSVSVMGKAAGGADRVIVRMNYNLDDETYNLQQVSEGYVARISALLDELLIPLQRHLAPRLWDKLLLDVLGTVSKRLEHSLRKCEFTSLGALALDSDMRDLISYAKDRLHAADYSSNVAVTRACVPLGRLLQVAKLLNVDDLEDVLDLITSSKRKNDWSLNLADAKAFLCARVEFRNDKVNDLLRLPDDE